MALVFASIAGSAVAQVPDTPQSCQEGTTPVSGVVADLLSRVPLAGATVTLQAPAEFVDQIVGQGTAGIGGRYRICVAGIGDDWNAVATLDTLESSPSPVSANGVDTLYIPWSQPVTIQGFVTVQGSGAAVPNARITIEDRPVRAITDDDGRFALRGVGGGSLVMVTEGLGYAPRTDTLLAPSGATLELEIGLAEHAIDLEPLVVTARVAPSTRVRGGRDLGMTPEEVEAVLHRSIDFVSMLRQANIPGLLIRDDGRGRTCIEFLRSSAGCAMVQVFVNGIRVGNPHDFVSTIDPVSVREFLVLRPAFAQFQYMGPLTRNGVLDIILK